MDDEGKDPVPESRRLRDQSKLLKKRAERLNRESQKRIERTNHSWQHLAVGRICASCKTTQMTGEFDDTVPCKAS
jgi:hypothetical protein